MTTEQPMIAYLAKIGRSNAVAIITSIATLGSLATILIVAAVLNRNGLDLPLGTAAILAICIALAVVLPISWYLVDLLLRVHREEQKMRGLASYDSLTGLLSRHAFFDTTNNYVSLAKRECIPFSVMIIDLDNFKKINDRYGHPAGDAVLRLFASVVNSVARRSDIIGRVGGEEFAMVLPSTAATEATEFAQRLHEAVNKAVLKYNGSAIRYTVSVGLAEFSTDSKHSVDDLLAQADVALYKAKQAGRNQTVTYSPTAHQAATG